MMATRRIPRINALALVAAAGLAVPALAQSPTGGTVANGSATISQNGNYTGITASNGAIINWQSFSIGQGQTVQFFQPSATSKVLNRVSGPDPSVLAGTLLSNGIVYITNSAGVYFTQGAIVNVGGIYAAAGNISNTDFLAGRNQFTNVTGTVRNDGVINSPAAHLVGQRVANYGTINAPQGMVTMTSGSEVYIGEQGGQVFARVEGAPANGGTGVTQAGDINAAGGQVRLGAGDMYAVAIDHPGRTTARSITLQGGKGGSNLNQNGGIVSVGGTLDASASAPGQTGGTVKVLGDRVGLYGAAVIDVSGHAGGGTAMVGGNRQGQGPEVNSQATYISPDAVVRADATGSGNGGSIFVWSDNLTRSYGHLSARGRNGNGGFIETSGKRELHISRVVDVTTTGGRAGTWLIDPDDLTFAAGGSGNTNIITSGTTVFTSSGAGALLDVDILTAALNGGATVEVRTGNSANPAGGTITLPAGIDIDYNGTGSNTLSLFAHRRIVLDGRIFDSVAGGGDLLNLNLTADVDLDGTGNIAINNIVNTGGGDFTVLRAIEFANTGVITTAGGDLTISLATTSGRATLGANLNAGSGTILLNPDVLLGSNITLTGGNVTFARTINSPGSPRNLTVSLTGPGFARFFGRIGDTAALRSITVGSTGNNGTTRLFAQSINSDGEVTFNDDVELGADLTISAANTTFARRIDSPGTASDLTISLLNGGTARFFGQIGSTDALASLSVSSADNLGQTRLGGGAVTTSGAQSYGQDVILLADTTLSGSALTFARRLDSGIVARDLTLNSTGLTRFFGTVGQFLTLDRLATNAGGSTLVSTGAMTARFLDFGDAVTLGADSVMNASGFVVFRSTLNSNAGAAHDLSITAPVVNFNGQVGNAGATTALGDLTVAGGESTLNTTILKAGFLDFSSNVVLAASATMDAARVRFGGALNSRAGENRGLTVNSPDTEFVGVVGGDPSGQLGSLTTDAAGTTKIAAAAMSAGIFTFNDAVVVSSNTNLTATTSATFGSTLDSAANEARNLVVTSPLTTFLGEVGGAVDGAFGTFATDLAGTTHIHGDVSADAIFFRDAVVIHDDITVGGGTTVDFASTINSQANQAFDLTINARGTALQGVIGGVTGGALGALVTDAQGVTTASGAITAASVEFNDTLNLRGGSVTTTGDQVYNGAVTITEDTTLTGNNITIGLSIDSSGTTSDRALTINTSGNGDTVFNGPIGSINPLASLTTNADGRVLFNGGVINTSGNQLYNDNVVLTLSSALSGNNVTFNGTVDSDSLARSLTINTSSGGVTTFAQTVGGTAALSSLITNADGTTRINGGIVAADGTVAFNDNVILGANTTITGSGVAFGGTLNSDFQLRSLAVNTVGGGVTAFNGAVGNSSALTTITTNADGSTQFFGPSIRTTGDQTYNDAVVLGADCVVTGEDLTFASTIDSTPLLSAAGLTLNSLASGTTTLAGDIGASNALEFITTDAGGVTRIGGDVNTTSSMTFNDTVRVFNDVTFRDSGNSGITFGGTLDSEGSARAVTLLINTASNATVAAPTIGRITFGGNVGSAFALSSLTLGGDRATSASAATISAGVNAGATIPNFALTITTSGAFRMGVGQKFTVVGDLTINAGSAVLGDISTLRSMTINSSSIAINTRPSGANLFVAGSSLSASTDLAVDFVAGTSITFSSTPTVLGSFGAPSFATPGSANISSTLSTFAQRDVGQVTDTMMRFNSLVLDLSGNGPSNANVSSAIAGALPDESQVGLVFRDTTAGKAQQDALAEIGIATSPADAQLLVDILSGRAFYNDATARDPWSDGYSITINRLSARAVAAVLETYRAVFLDNGQPNPEKVRATLTAAWQEYSAAAGDKADPLGYRAYCEAVPAQAQAVYYLDGLRELFAQLGYLGLSPAELRHARATILRAVQVPGLSAAQLEAAITATNMGTVAAR